MGIVTSTITASGAATGGRTTANVVSTCKSTALLGGMICKQGMVAVVRDLMVLSVDVRSASKGSIIGKGLNGSSVDVRSASKDKDWKYQGENEHDDDSTEGEDLFLFDHPPAWIKCIVLVCYSSFRFLGIECFLVSAVSWNWCLDWSYYSFDIRHALLVCRLCKTANFCGVVLAGLLVHLLVNLGLKYVVATGIVLFFVSTFMWSFLRSIKNSVGSSN
ncbi:hypothetical protein NE237_024840 [Protea cynaroides]|uniref:Uncharacterized protein n=1 Tax=Protea cynaroides TaxID=273540 RepID=A0A9Q0H5W9_9MAGN|nr:hypothetical protein NE237_024840 [Protea cynaroides]